MYVCVYYGVKVVSKLVCTYVQQNYMMIFSSVSMFVRKSEYIYCIYTLCCDLV